MAPDAGPADNPCVQADRMAAGGRQDTSKSQGRRGLLVLGVGVALAHLAALQALPRWTEPPPLTQTRAFTTRSIVVQPPAPPPPAAVAAAPVPAPAPRKRPRPWPVPPASPPPAEALAQAAPPAPMGEAVEPAPQLLPYAPVDPPMPEGPAMAEQTTQEEATAAPPQAAASQAEPPVAAASAPAAVFGPTAPESADAPAMALAIPGSVRLKYTLTGESKQMAYHALGELLWLQDGQSYDARLEYSAFLVGSRVRTSSGKLTARGLAPTRFSDKWRRRDLAAHFERDKGEVSFSANTPRSALLPDAQDQLSVLLQLASMLAGDPARYTTGSSITVPVVGPRDADVWTFTLQGEELLHLPYDNLQTLKLTRNPRRPYDQKVEAWLAPSLSYLPVRVRITLANGDFVDQQLRTVDSP